MSLWDPKNFFQDREYVALRVAATEVFSLLKRSLDLPTAWAALVTRHEGGHTFVRPGGVVERGDADTLTFVRSTAVELSFAEEGVHSRDGFQFQADVRVSLSVIPDRDELLSFSKTILGSRRVAKTETIARFLQPTIWAALSAYAAETDASDLMQAGILESVSAALHTALQAPFFTAGLMMEGTPVATFDSDSFRRVMASQEQAVRHQREHESERTIHLNRRRDEEEHLEHLSSILLRLDKLAAESPSVEFPELVKTFSEHQRGELYKALFARSTPTARTQWIVAATAEELLFFDPAALPTPRRRFSLSGAAGPIRSIQTVRGPTGAVLFIGAATGVYRLPIDRAEPDLTLTVPQAAAVRGGFNAVATTDGQVLASHSELGILEWSLEKSETPRVLFKSESVRAKAIRGIQIFEGKGFCTVDDRVLCWPIEASTESRLELYTGSTAPLTALWVGRRGVFAGTSDGDVLHWPIGMLDSPHGLHHGRQRPVESVWTLEARGVTRLFFTDTSTQVHAQVLDDHYSCRYEAGGQTLRRVEIADDCLIAINEQRDRLFYWKLNEPEKPADVIPIGHLCGRTVQDVCLV